MKALHIIIPIVVVSALLYTSCEPFDTVSDVPELNFKSLTPYYRLDTNYIPGGFELDSTKAAELIFSFIDGDADFGVDKVINPYDTINFYLIPFRKIGGLYDSLDAIVYGAKYTVRNVEALNRIGQNKTIKGEIKLQIYYHLIPPYDTLRYDFYIVDRAGHKSNVESTTDIGFSH
jgi:hypothetical protein